MPVQVGPNPDLGWHAVCLDCKCERWLYLGVSAGPFNSHMAHCEACGRVQNPPIRADDWSRSEPHGTRSVAERERDLAALGRVTCRECGTPGAAAKDVTICPACIDKYHPGR